MSLAIKNRRLLPSVFNMSDVAAKLFHLIMQLIHSSLALSVAIWRTGRNAYFRDPALLISEIEFSSILRIEHLKNFIARFNFGGRSDVANFIGAGLFSCRCTCG